MDQKTLENLRAYLRSKVDDNMQGVNDGDERNLFSMLAYHDVLCWLDHQEQVQGVKPYSRTCSSCQGDGCWVCDY